MASITRSDLLDALADSTLSTALVSMTNGIKAQYEAGHATITDVAYNRMLRKECIKHMIKRLQRMDRRKQYAYQAYNDASNWTV